MLEERERRAGGLGVGELDERLVEQHGDTVGQALEQALERGRREQLPGGVVGARERNHAHGGVVGCGEQRVDSARDWHSLAVRSPRHDRVERIRGPRGEQLLARLD